MTPFERWRIVALTSSATTVALAIAGAFVEPRVAHWVYLPMLGAMFCMFGSSRFAIAALRVEHRDTSADFEQRLRQRVELERAAAANRNDEASE